MGLPFNLRYCSNTIAKYTKPSIVSKHVLMMVLINKTFQHLKNEILVNIRVLPDLVVAAYKTPYDRKFTMELHLKASAS